MSAATAIIDRVVAGGEATPAEVSGLLSELTPAELREAAHRVTVARTPKRFDFCGIVNARSGRCGENCKWCAQSAHWRTACEKYGWIGAEACVDAALKAEANGVSRFGIVTSGRGQTPAQIGEVCAAVKALRERTHLQVCASLGLVDEAGLAKLKAAGLKRIHCNLETAPSRFAALCTTHTAAEKIATLKTAKRLGFEICCGGIIGMGETDAELVEFAFALKAIAPDSIPINFLHPIAGTPLGESPRVTEAQILKAVAVLRIVNPSIPLRFAGGRRDMSDETAARAIYVGISAGIAGPLLTTPGADYNDDRQLALAAGYDVRPETAKTAGKSK